jgi:uncharacterized protein YjbI with pentapeptide repeats
VDTFASNSAEAAVGYKARAKALLLRVSPLVLVLRGASVAAPVSAFFFARHAGASVMTAGVFSGLAIVAVYLSSRARTTTEKAADLGRGLVVTLVVTVTLAWVQHEGSKQSARDALAVSLSGGSKFAGIDLHAHDLSGFYLARKDLSEADLHDANLRGAVLRHAHLEGADLSGADLTGADLSDAKLDSRSSIAGANLSEANLTTAVLNGVNVAGARLARADLTGTRLRGADLRGADLRDAQLAGADLRFSLLEADLRGAVLGADARNARLGGAALARARWDERTQWPSNFDVRVAVARAKKRPDAPAVPASAAGDHVAQVLDGDTIILRERGPVRLLGINAPQVERGRVECYGSEAARDVARVLPAGASVRYVVGKAPSDRYRRTLAFVWLDSGRLANELVLERGDATVLLTSDRRYSRRFRAAAVRAEMSLRGLWGACPAGGH